VSGALFGRRMLTSWPPYAVLLAGAGGVLTNQCAYRTAGLSASMPVLNIVNGLIALTFGVTVFSEVPRHSPLFLLKEAVAPGCMAVGLWRLVRLEEEHLTPSARAAEWHRPVAAEHAPCR
jgi:hypothetical protein